MTVLSVNVNKIATLRNSRGKDLPSVLRTALYLERCGAEGITVHPRPDGRHIRSQDVLDLKKHLRVELNIEGYPSPQFLDLVESVQPGQVTLVPDPPEAITSNAGWRWQEHHQILEASLGRLKKNSFRIALFMDPYDAGAEDLKHMRGVGADRIELYTEQYADSFGTDQEEKTLGDYRAFADLALAEGLELNAGHDLNARNVRKLLKRIPEIKEVSIGHALISDALEWGLKDTLKEYQRAVDLSQPFEPRASELSYER